MYEEMVFLHGKERSLVRVERGGSTTILHVWGWLSMQDSCNDGGGGGVD